MKAIYENHYLTDTDVANFARQSFAELAAHFSKDQNNNLVRFLARGMASGDWEKLIDEMIDLGKVEYAASEDTRQKAKKLATYMRKIPEHWVPFGHPHITIRMEAPVPIARQLFKHKIGFVESEESRRYISSKPVLYVPEHFRGAAASVKQGSEGIHRDSSIWLDSYEAIGNNCIQAYENMIAAGVCPEQARFILPQGCEVHWVWTGSLYAYSNFYNQRSDSHAQKESQELAEEVNKIIAPLFPVSWAALTQGAY